jgi:hypothetical protein
MIRRKVYRFVGIAVIVGLIVILVVLWTSPSGMGDYRVSPNGKYTAHAMNMSTGAFLGKPSRYIEISVEETSTHREIWRIIHHPSDNAKVPDYGIRGIKFVEWAADSGSVTIPIASDDKLVLSIP